MIWAGRAGHHLQAPLYSSVFISCHYYAIHRRACLDLLQFDGSDTFFCFYGRLYGKPVRSKEMRCGMEMADDLDVDPVRVGTRGTIGSLMYRELESMRRMDKINAGVRRSARNDAVSISCGRPLASLAGYRLSTRKQASQDSNARPSFCEGSVTPRCSSASGKDNARRGFETPTCKTKLGFERQERQMDYSYKGLPRRKPVSFDSPGGIPVVCGEEEKAALRAESGGEFRTPMLPKEGDAGSGGARRSLERRAAAISSFVEVVDLSCNGNDKVWGSPIASRLRRLSFSRLSESVN